MDLTVPDHLPDGLKGQLLDLINEYQEELITFKGYNSKRDKLLHEYNVFLTNFEADDNRTKSLNRKPTILSFDPIAVEANLKQKHLLPNGSITTSSISSGINKKVLQKMKSTYHMDTDSISSGKISLSRQNTTISLPFNQSSLAKSGYNPTEPLFPRTSEGGYVDKFKLSNTSLSSLLNKRAEQHGKDLAIISVNSKGKEKAITWSKLSGKVNKLSNELEKMIKLLKKRGLSSKEKQQDSYLGKVSHMSKVLLWYNPDDIIDFTGALFACFNADLIPVPVNLETYKMAEIEEIIKICDIKIVLISNECHQALEIMTDKLDQTNEMFYNFAKVDLSKMDEHHQTNGNKLLKTAPWINLKFVKTTDIGTSSKNSKVYQIPGISYIEFTRTPLGILSGVVMKYKTLEAQFSALAKIMDSRMTNLDSKQGFVRAIRLLNDKQINSASKALRIVSTLDPTRSTGLIHGLLFSIYTGNLFVYCNFAGLSTKPRELESLLGKYRGNMLLTDQLQIKQIVLNYLDNPSITQSRKHQNKKIDLSCVKFCLSSCNTVDDDTSDMIVKKWLNNLGCINSSKVYSPMLTLADFGGIFLALRDELNWSPHEFNKSLNDDCDSEKKTFDEYNDNLADYDTIFVEKEALKDNEIKIGSLENGLSYPEKYLKVSSFGYPIPDVTTCIVSPDHKILSPKNIVGEIWITSDSLVNEFYQLPKINNFVFNAKLEFSKMNYIINNLDHENPSAMKPGEINQSFNQLKNTSFLRTKLVGFEHKNKLYVLASIDDVLLQNKLYRLPNGKHTINKFKLSDESMSDIQISENEIPLDLKQFSKHNLAPVDLESISSKNSAIKKSKLQMISFENHKSILESHYLQHISATVVSMSENISEISCFEIPNNKDKHFLVLVFETPLLKKTTKISSKSDKLLVPLVNNVFKLLWKFHGIQPYLILAVPDGCLPRRYCSLEIANSLTERQFYNGQLDIKYLKFQLDSVIADHIPNLDYKRDKKETEEDTELSVFSAHLSAMRNKLLKDAIVTEITNGEIDTADESVLRLFEQDTSKELTSAAALDERNGIDVCTKFSNILALLEYRIKKQPNEFAFCDGFANSNKKSNSNNYHKAITWKFLSTMIGSYMKKISSSKIPLHSGDYVIIICDNSTEYIAIVFTCLYLGFNIIPMISLANKNKSVESTCEYLVSVVRAFNVKRIFVDYKNHTLLEDTNTLTGKHLKKSKLKNRLPKITLFCKNKIKVNYTLEFVKKSIDIKTSDKAKNKIVFLNENESLWNITTTYSLEQIFKLCATYKDSLKINYSNKNISITGHTQHIGFMKSCMLGIFLGTSTTLYALNDIKNDSRDFFQDLLHLNLGELYLDRDLFAVILIKSYGKSVKKIFKNIPHILIPYSGKPNHNDLISLINKYGLESECNMAKVNFIYENKFNPFISCRIDSPIVLKLELDALRNGVAKELSDVSDTSFVSVYDLGTLVNGDLKVINPETLQPTYLTEIGEIVVSSTLNILDYNCLNLKSNKLYKDNFFNEQLTVDIEGKTYIRTGDLGFLKPYIIDENQENIIFNLGNIEDTIEHDGLHFVSDLENCIKDTNQSIISKSMCVKVGKYTAALVQLKNTDQTISVANQESKDSTISPKLTYNQGNLVPMIATRLLFKHNFLVNMVVFVDYIDIKNRHLTLNKFINNKKGDYIFGVYTQ
ncbi:hypothetical protein QEN19_004237 [Hanseniaspora menglaensis]